MSIATGETDLHIWARTRSPPGAKASAILIFRPSTLLAQNPPPLRGKWTCRRLHVPFRSCRLST